MNVYYWEILDEKLDPDHPVCVFAMGDSVEAAIVAAVRRVVVLKATLPKCRMSKKRLADRLEQHLCELVPLREEGWSDFVLYHVGKVGNVAGREVERG